MAMVTQDIVYEERIPDDAKSLIKGLLRMEGRDRMTFENIFKHDFVKRHYPDYMEKKKDCRLVMPHNHPYADVLINYYNPKIIEQKKVPRGSKKKFLDPYGGIMTDPKKQQEYIRLAAEQSGIPLEKVVRAKLKPDPKTGKVIVKFVLKEEKEGQGNQGDKSGGDEEEEGKYKAEEITEGGEDQAKDKVQGTTEGAQQQDPEALKQGTTPDTQTPTQTN